MKKQLFIPFVLALGVFLMIDTSLLAQTSSSKSTSKSSGTSTTTETETAVRAERAERAARAAREYGRASNVYVTTPDVDVRELGDYNFVYSTGVSSSEKNSKLMLSKRYSGQSTAKTGNFSIEEGVTKIRLSISGQVEVGKITLALYMPGNKELKTLVIDDSANVSWSQSINVSEEESKYYGEWTYKIKAEAVEGQYNMSISTY